jgi:hypothetical protein
MMKLALRRARPDSASTPGTARLRLLTAAALISILQACGGGGSDSLTADTLIVTGTNGMNSTGVPGGPFSPPSVTYTLSNAGSAPIDWAASNTQSWLTLSQDAGMLDAGASTSVVVTIGVQANSLAEGSYQDTVVFTNLTNGSGDTTRPVGLTITGPSGLAMTTATRSTGVAPLAVFFDAVGAASGVVQPAGSPPDYASFHYEWTFGDPASGSWSVGGESKDTALGYVTAHVFETPGNYRVTLRVVQDDGTVNDYYQDLVVEDPDTVYAGQTYYVSSAGSDANNGLSPGAPFQTVSRAMTTLFASNGPRRVLFRRGDAFTAATSISTGNRTGPFTIGAYGVGADPLLNVTHAGNGIRLETTVSDVRIQDVDLTCSHPSNTGHGVELGRDSLLLRSTVRAFGVSVGGSETDNIANTVSDCELLDSRAYGLYYAPPYHPSIIFDPPIHLAVMGTRFDNSVNSLIRTYVSRSLWQANLFQRSQTSAARLLGIQQPKKAEFVVISNNHFDSPPSWILEIGPENSQNGNGIPQIVENVLVEGNRFTVPAPGPVDRFIMIWARYVTVRNNVFDHSQGDWGGSITIDRRGIGPVPVGIRVENNTAYRSDFAPSFRFVDAASQDPTLVRNNIVYSPAVASTVALGTVIEQANYAFDPLFEAAAQGDFHLQAGSPVIDQGVLITNRADFEGNERPLRSAHDIGAFETP